MNVLLTPHFSIQELIFSEAASRLGLPNSPDVDQLGNLKRLCVVLLEPARELIGEPLRVTSGFRTVEVNGHLPGASRTSAHMDGRAADVMPLYRHLEQASIEVKTLFGSIPTDHAAFRFLG